jgi:hypothetical protein
MRRRPPPNEYQRRWTRPEPAKSQAPAARPEPVKLPAAAPREQLAKEPSVPTGQRDSSRIAAMDSSPSAQRGTERPGNQTERGTASGSSGRDTVSFHRNSTGQGHCLIGGASALVYPIHWPTHQAWNGSAHQRHHRHPLRSSRQHRPPPLPRQSCRLTRQLRTKTKRSECSRSKRSMHHQRRR